MCHWKTDIDIWARSLPRMKQNQAQSTAWQDGQCQQQCPAAWAYSHLACFSSGWAWLQLGLEKVFTTALSYSSAATLSVLWYSISQELSAATSLHVGAQCFSPHSSLEEGWGFAQDSALGGNRLSTNRKMNKGYWKDSFVLPFLTFSFISPCSEVKKPRERESLWIINNN